jgi:tight adherence protein C
MLANRVIESHEAADVGGRLRQLIALFRIRTKRVDQDFEYQATDFVRALSLLSRNAVPVAVAISWLAQRMQGEIGKVLKDAASDLELSADINDLLVLWQKLPSPTMEELSQKLKVSLQRGTAVAQQLEQLAASSLAQSHALLLRKAGSNETKMLIPTIFLILPITILFTIYPSVLLLDGQL